MKHIVLFLVLISIISCKSTPENGNVETALFSKKEKTDPIVDIDIMNSFRESASNHYIEFGGTHSNDYKRQLLHKECSAETIEALNKPLSGSDFYRKSREGVLIIGKLYTYGDISEYQLSTAGAFVISANGICVTNYHVYKSYDPSKPSIYESTYVRDYRGEIFPVIEILAASKKDDLAIFRIETKGEELFPLPLGMEQAVGDEVQLISHPGQRFFRFGKGFINRTYIKPGTSSLRQSISADFAKGSSGAPVMDQCGNVVGVVAGTQNIYYNPEGSGYQMTIKEIIPVSRLKEMID